MAARFLFAFAFVATLTVALAAAAQTLAPPEQLAAMRKLDFLVGNWQGGGTMEYVPARPCSFHSQVVVQSKLGGLLLVIDGVNRGQLAGQGPETVVHGVYGLIFFDTERQEFRFVGFSARGFLIDTTAKVEERRVSWGTKVPRLGDVEYTIAIDEEGHWLQTGDITDKDKSRRFFEMTLQRVVPAGQSATADHGATLTNPN